MLVTGRYGFHRDELYFVEAGRHLDWAYADQPTLIPVLASSWYDLVGGSLPAFRVLPAAAAAATVLVAAATSRALGGTYRSAAWTSTIIATATTLLVVGHLFGTAAFDMLATSASVLLLIRATQDNRARNWIALGLMAAVAVQVKFLPLIVLGCCAVGLLVAGPRSMFRSPWPWLASAIAAAGLAPTVAWQAANGWPQLALAESIASGSSGTSVGRVLLLPMLVTVTGGTFVVVLLGAALAWRSVDLCWLAISGAMLLTVLLLTGGKPYYAFSLVPALVAAGVPALRSWIRRKPSRRGLMTGVVAGNAVIGAILALPILPASHAAVAVVYDQREQVGWAELVDSVASVAADTDAQLVLTENYGQAGALDRASSHGEVLPPVFSGHNAYWWWGPPANEPTRIVTVGWRNDTDLLRWFTTCRTLATVTNQAGVENDELGTPVRFCVGPTHPWHLLWSDLRQLR